MVRGLLSVAVVVALRVSSCGGSDAVTSSSAPTTELSTSTTGSVPSKADDVPPASLGSVFDAAGVVLVDSFSAVGGGPSGLELSRFQVDSMGREAAADGGYLGVVLDELVGSPGGLPFSYLIARWLVSAPTPTADAAAKLMGDQEWTQAPAIVFPSAVLALFVADAVAASGGSAEGFASGAGPSGLMPMLRSDRANGVPDRRLVDSFR